MLLVLTPPAGDCRADVVLLYFPDRSAAITRSSQKPLSSGCANNGLASHLQDSSALLTGLLLAVSIPPLAPRVDGVVPGKPGFAIIIAKQLYGGLGQNPFNPAMRSATWCY